MLPEEVISLERRSIGANGEPTLSAAYTVLVRHWQEGNRDRDVGLHLMFLAWYLMVEPPYLTGLDGSSQVANGLRAQFNEVYAHFAEAQKDDAEFLYTVGLMAQVSPWSLGDESEWSKLSRAYRTRYRRIYPEGMDPTVFDATHAYGDYFNHHALVKGGY